MYIRVLIAFVGLGIVAGAVTLLLKHLLWRRLAGAAERGTAFLLIVGASGAGKSSLARAGLIRRR